jgi:hypothetical protein
MCPETLDKLAKVVYLWVQPDHTKEQLDRQVQYIIEALKRD